MFTKLQAPHNFTHVGSTTYYIDDCTSTQDILKNLLSENNPIGTAVIADRQSQGRGRHGNTWVDTGHPQLFTSISLKPTFPTRQLPMINLLIALCAVEVLNTKCNIDRIHVKWPNDIYLKQKKVGGILSELIQIKKETTIVIGFGLNLSGSFKNTPLENKATSFLEHKYHIERFGFFWHWIEFINEILDQPHDAIILWMKKYFDKYASR